MESGRDLTRRKTGGGSGGDDDGYMQMERAVLRAAGRGASDHAGGYYGISDANGYAYEDITDVDE
jgi:hypothetical protein